MALESAGCASASLGPIAEAVKDAYSQLRLAQPMTGLRPTKLDPIELSSKGSIDGSVWVAIDCRGGEHFFAVDIEFDMNCEAYYHATHLVSCPPTILAEVLAARKASQYADT